jgi:hypothetical protein
MSQVAAQFTPLEDWPCYLGTNGQSHGACHLHQAVGATIALRETARLLLKPFKSGERNGADKECAG